MMRAVEGLMALVFVVGCAAPASGDDEPGDPDAPPGRTETPTTSDPGDTITIAVGQRDAVTHVEVDRVDPIVDATPDLRFPPAVSTTVVLRHDPLDPNLDAFAGGWTEALDLRFRGDRTGDYEGAAVSARYTDGTGVWGTASGDLTSGQVAVTRYDDRVQGTYSLQLCSQAELDGGGCDSGTRQLEGTFDIGLEAARSPLPDLAPYVTSVRYDPLADEVVVSVDILNEGSAPFEGFVEFALWADERTPPDPDLDPPDHTDRQFLTPVGAFGGRTGRSLRFVPPVQRGRLWLYLDASDEVVELDLDDNLAEPRDWDVGLPDLTGEIGDVLYRNGVFRVSATLNNIGVADLVWSTDFGASGEYRIDLCPEATSTSPPQCARAPYPVRIRPVLLAGESLPIVVDIPWPGLTGPSLAYLRLRTDNGIRELDTTNNTSPAFPFDPTAAPNTAFVGYVPSVGTEEQPSLQSTPFEVFGQVKQLSSYYAVVADPSTQYRVRLTGMNATPFAGEDYTTTVRFYDNPDFTGLHGTCAVNNSEYGRDEGLSCVIESPPSGDLWVEVPGNGLWTDPEEGTSYSFSMVEVEEPDLRVQIHEVTLDSDPPWITFDFSVLNDGPGAVGGGFVAVEFHPHVPRFSFDPTFSLSRAVEGARVLLPIDIAPGEAYRTTHVMPLPPGLEGGVAYAHVNSPLDEFCFLGCVRFDAPEEVDDDNNTSPPFVWGNELPDLTVEIDGLGYYAAAERLLVEGTIRNLGGPVGGCFDLSLWTNDTFAGPSERTPDQVTRVCLDLPRGGSFPFEWFTWLPFAKDFELPANAHLPVDDRDQIAEIDDLNNVSPPFPYDAFSLGLP
ncbi:MAG: hypothetical protein AAF602_20825 [Myxococcota bacterium]